MMPPNPSFPGLPNETLPIPLRLHEHPSSGTVTRLLGFSSVVPRGRVSTLACVALAFGCVCFRPRTKRDNDK